jgi:hypothetical protein
VTHDLLPPSEPRRMADGRCVGKFPQKIIGDQRLPLRVVINECLDMLLEEIGGDRHVSLLPRIVPDQSRTRKSARHGPETAFWDIVPTVDGN